MGDVDLPEEPAKPSSRPLAYKTEGGAVSVRGFRLLLALTLLNTTLLGTVVLGPQLFPFLHAQWSQWRTERAARRAAAAVLQAQLARQQQCLAYTAPAGAVVYDEHPAEAEKMLRAGGAGFVAAWETPSTPAGWIPPIQVVVPKFFAEYQAAVYGSGTLPTEPLLFLHERTTPNGGKYLVAVQLWSNTEFSRIQEVVSNTGGGTEVVIRQSKRRALIARAFPARPDQPPTGRTELLYGHVPLVLPDTAEREVLRVSTGPLQTKPPPIDYGNALRLYVGQPDPKDASHFTIPYQLDGRDGVIDGWLREDKIELRPREGEWIFDGQAQWKLTPPETQPLIYPGVRVQE